MKRHIAVVLLAFLAVTGCFGGNDTSSPTPSTETSPAPTAASTPAAPAPTAASTPAAPAPSTQLPEPDVDSFVDYMEAAFPNMVGQDQSSTVEWALDLCDRLREANDPDLDLAIETRLLADQGISEFQITTMYTAASLYLCPDVEFPDAESAP